MFLAINHEFAIIRIGLQPHDKVTLLFVHINILLNPAQIYIYVKNLYYGKTNKLFVSFRI